MGVRLARQDPIAMMLERQRPQGLIAGESSPEEGRAAGRHLGGMFAQPALPCGAFTVRLGMAFLRHEGRGGNARGCDGPGQTSTGMRVA